MNTTFYKILSIPARLVAVVAILLSGFLSVAAADIAAEADSAYMHNEYDKAVRLYTDLLRQNPSSPSILYNLGCAYYKSGNEGEARLCLERAHRLDPSDSRITRNISYLASRIEDANKAELKGKKGNVAPDELGFFADMHSWIAAGHSSDLWAGLAAGSFVLFVIAIALYVLSQNVIVKKTGFFSSIVLFVASAVFIAFAFMAAKEFNRTDLGIVTSFKTVLTEEPADDAKAVGASLHRGTKLQILDSRLNPEGKTGWYKVRLNSDNIGWIPADNLTVI